MNKSTSHGFQLLVCSEKQWVLAHLALVEMIDRLQQEGYQGYYVTRQRIVSRSGLVLCGVDKMGFMRKRYCYALPSTKLQLALGIGALRDRLCNGSLDGRDGIVLTKGGAVTHNSCMDSVVDVDELYTRCDCEAGPFDNSIMVGFDVELKSVVFDNPYIHIVDEGCVSVGRVSNMEYVVEYDEKELGQWPRSPL